MPVFVNNVEITDDEVHAEMQHHPAENMEQARHKAAEALVIRELLLQEAKEKQLLENMKKVSPDIEEQAIEALIKREVLVPKADKESCERYYHQNPERFKDKKTGETLPLEQVYAYIEDYLHMRSLRTGISQYLKVLTGKAKIIGIDLEGSDNPLVQ